jgi:hypothetical protein
VRQSDWAAVGVVDEAGDGLLEGVSAADEPQAVGATRIANIAIA